MEALEAAMKKHNIHVEHSSTPTSNSSSGMALSACRCQSSQSGYALNVSSSSHSHEWLIDSGASYHMAKNKAMFSSLHDCNTENIYVGDDRSLNVVGTGTVHLDNGQFNDVLCVPTLSSNLLSVYQITHSGEGKIVEFSPHDVVIKDLRDPKKILATVSKLWHERFGHLNYRSLQHLCKENMVTGLPMVSWRDGVCSGCVLGKHHRDSFEKRASWHASAPLQLVHSDLCGPLPVSSFSGCKYFLTFIDDFSRRTWVYFLKLKSEVFNTFFAFKAFVEKQSGHQILKLRTDNGGEYVKNTFINFCTENGIQMQHTVPYTSQQNGVAERKNRTLKEMANCMLQSKGLSLSFWAEAINCANYIINRTPTKVLKNITPEEAWSSIKPDVSHFRVFGSEAWAHIPDEKHKALEPKSDLAGDATDQRRTRSQFERASSLLAQAPVNHDPDTFAEASGHPHWEAAVNEEYHSLLANDTWDLVPLPKGRKLVRCKWVYRTKYGPDGKVDKHKARLVAKGFSQVEGIDYTETFSPVPKMNSIRLVLSLAASLNGKSIRWMLNLPSCMGTCMKKSIWNNPLASSKQTPALCYSDNTVYTKKVGNSLIILVLYVDDLILTGSDPNLINHVKSSPKKKFEMTDLGHLHYFLGLQVLQSKEGISLSQSKYACNILRHFHMEDCKPAPSPFQSGVKLSVSCTSPEVDATLYRQLVGKLLYLTHTRPDLSFAVGLVARFMQNPRESHWKAAKRILRYVREAEYRGAVEASREALWLRQILSEFGFEQQHPTTLWCDNQSAIQLCKDPVHHQRSKHIELHMHFIRKLIHDHVLEVQYCSTDDQVADIFTKALTEAKFTKLRYMLGVQEVVTKGG
eukprot:PITA_32314